MPETRMDLGPDLRADFNPDLNPDCGPGSNPDCGPDFGASPRPVSLVRSGRPAAAILCDTPPLARLCGAALGRLGLSSRVLPPSNEALPALRATPPALLLVLLMGRDTDALALCQTVGQDPAFAGTRLVIVQDSARDIDRRRAHALGADAVLPLPLDPGALDRAVRTLLPVRA